MQRYKRTNIKHGMIHHQLAESVQARDVEAEAGSGSRGSGPFSVEAEARKIHRFHRAGKNGERKEIGCAILRRRTIRGSINIEK